MKKANVSASETAYIGDDVIDIPVFKACGLSFCPADAHPIVKASADYICNLNGGEGAVREVCDLILTARDKTDTLGASI